MVLQAENPAHSSGIQVQKRHALVVPIMILVTFIIVSPPYLVAVAVVCLSSLLGQSEVTLWILLGLLTG